MRGTVCGNIRFMRIFVGFTGEDESKDTGWSKTANFSAFGVYIFDQIGIRPKVNMYTSCKALGYCN